MNYNIGDILLYEEYYYDGVYINDYCIITKELQINPTYSQFEVCWLRNNKVSKHYDTFFENCCEVIK